MRQAIIDSLVSRFASYADIIATLDADSLGKKLEVPKHKSILEHTWCIIGARESYAQAIKSGEWSGFSCSLTEFTLPHVAEKIQSSAEDVLAVIDEVAQWTSEREALLLKLAEHEVMHEGAVIRHMYALELEIPKSVQWA